MLRSLNIAVMQSEVDAGRLRDLGMPPDRIHTAGNLKFDAGAVSSPTEKTAEIRERFAFGSDVPLILAASTHAPEEKILIESFKQLNGRARLMLAPRHPERFQEVASLIRESGMSWAKRTNPAAAADASASVILLDTIGELPATYALAAVVFVGGSIVDRGGHNVLEPAAAGAPVVTGAHTHNFHAIVDLLNEANAIVQLPPLPDAAASDELAKVFTQLLADPKRRTELAARAKQLVVENQGAAERTIKLIAPLLSLKRPDRSQLNPVLAANAHTS
jgi:3-deoxy-D-manno-octulosonic-acid transferase